MTLRLAVLADIHSNRPALDAVLADLDRRGGADLIVDLGDCASGPLWPHETMDRLDALGAMTVRGNQDRIVVAMPPDAPPSTTRFTVESITPDQRARLGALPLIAMAAPGVLACHATPTDDATYLLDRVEGGRLVQDRPEAIASRLGDVGSTRLVMCGHSHRPDLVHLPTGVLVLNPGSVGLPAYRDPTPPAHVSEAGSPLARYALVELASGDALQDVPVVTLLAVPYDTEVAARRAEANGRPDWAHALRTGWAARAA